MCRDGFTLTFRSLALLPSPSTPAVRAFPNRSRNETKATESEYVAMMLVTPRTHATKLGNGVRDSVGERYASISRVCAPGPVPRNPFTFLPFYAALREMNDWSGLVGFGLVEAHAELTAAFLSFRRFKRADFTRELFFSSDASWNVLSPRWIRKTRSKRAPCVLTDYSPSPGVSWIRLTVVTCWCRGSE